MMKRFISAVLLLAIVLNTSAQQEYTKQQLVEDLKVLNDILVNTNPILTNAGKDSIDKKFSQAIKSFPLKKATGLEFVRYIGRLKANTGYDDHAGITLNDKFFPATASFFPVPIYIMQDSMLVNTEKSPLPFGSIVQSINGVKVNEIIKELAGAGNNSNFRKYQLNTSFSFLFFMKYGAKDTFNITYKAPVNDAPVKTITCTAVTVQALAGAQNAAVFPLNRFEPLNKVHTQFDAQSGTYYLQFRSFAFGEVRPDSMPTSQQIRPAPESKRSLEVEAGLDSLFRDIRSKAARFLVIDIRGNGGGLMDVPGLLFSYLADSVFYEAHYQKMLPVKDIPLTHLKKIDNTFIASKSDAPKRVYRLYDGFHTSGGKSNHTILYKREPSPYRFPGKVALLVDEGTFSAAAYFTALFRANKRGSIIGQEPGGSIRELTAGHLLHYELPNTRIQVTLPLMQITFDKKLYNDIEGDTITPDFQGEYQYFLKKQDWGRAINRHP
ncbi:S41 family peptidase [Niabella aquatica]